MTRRQEQLLIKVMITWIPEGQKNKNWSFNPGDVHIAWLHWSRIGWRVGLIAFKVNDIKVIRMLTWIQYSLTFHPVIRSRILKPNSRKKMILWRKGIDEVKFNNGKRLLGWLIMIFAASLITGLIHFEQLSKHSCNWQKWLNMERMEQTVVG